MRPLPPSLLLSAWLHGSLLGFFWLPSIQLWEVIEDAEEGAQMGAEQLAGQAISASLSNLDPKDIHRVSITLIDPAPELQAELPQTTAEVAPSRTNRPAADVVADADTDGGEVGRGGSFDAKGQSGDGTASRTKSKKPCEDRAEIWAIREGNWGIQRSVVDYYASHFPELDRQVGSEPAAGPDGKPFGLKIVLSRCSVLKEAGLRSGDIIHSANGLKVHSYAQAIAA
ncbi:MAG TPA: hypothetical protein PKY30_09650, partial [Myxococcota bacterium]|nr:hypothetical protein [Myxococcota bacterium]